MELTPLEQNILRTISLNEAGFELICKKMKDDIAADFANMTPTTLLEQQSDWRAIDKLRQKVLALALNLNE